MKIIIEVINVEYAQSSPSGQDIKSIRTPEHVERLIHEATGVFPLLRSAFYPFSLHPDLLDVLTFGVIDDFL